MNAHVNIDSATLHNIDLEQEILGSVIINNSAFDVIDSKLTAADFFEPLHCTIFDAIRSVHASHGVITAGSYHCINRRRCEPDHR